MISTSPSDGPSDGPPPSPVPFSPRAFTGARHSSDTELLLAVATGSRTALAHVTAIDGDELADADGLCDGDSDAPPDGPLAEPLRDGLGDELAAGIDDGPSVAEPDIRADGLDDGLVEASTTPVLVDGAADPTRSCRASERSEGDGLVIDGESGWQTGGSSDPLPADAPAPDDWAAAHAVADEPGPISPSDAAGTSNAMAVASATKTNHDLCDTRCERR